MSRKDADQHNFATGSNSDFENFALEERIVFDGALGESAANISDAPALSQTPEPATTAEQFEAASAALVEVVADKNEIAFVDLSVENVEFLLQNISPQTTIVFIDANRDGVEQVADTLAGQSGVDAIHIISHGRSGELNLGSATLNANSIAGQHADEIAVIRSALSADADMLIYGCDFGANVSGDAAVRALAIGTGADIAASNDATGASALGGDWDLEVSNGAIEAVALNAPEWNGLLAPLTITANAQPTTNGLTGVGAVGLWENSGSVGGTNIDIRATVTSATGGATISFASAIGAYGPNLPADDLWLQVTGGDVTVRWEIFASGTNQSIIAVGDPNFRISDIDGHPSLNLPFPQIEIEGVSPSLNGLTDYTVETVTNLDSGVSGNALVVRGTENQDSEAASLVGFNWSNVSSWDVTYSAALGMGTRFFFHDGDGDFTFSAHNTTPMLSIDLDDGDTTSRWNRLRWSVCRERI